MLTELKKKKMETAKMTFSDSAKTQIEKLIASSDDKEVLLRVSVSGGGCSGFQYHFDFDQSKKEDDLQILSGNKVLGVIDETSYDLLKESQIDYVNELSGSYFKINNPNASGTCGCGSSFSV